MKVVQATAPLLRETSPAGRQYAPLSHEDLCLSIGPLSCHNYKL